MRRKLAGKSPTDESPKTLNFDDPLELDKIHIALRNMMNAGEIEEREYFKALVDLIARWILLGRREDALSLVCELTPEYMEKGLPAHMEADPKFKRKAFAVASYLAPDISEISDDDVELATLMLKKPVAQA